MLKFYVTKHFIQSCHACTYLSRQPPRPSPYTSTSFYCRKYKFYLADIHTIPEQCELLTVKDDEHRARLQEADVFTD